MSDEIAPADKIAIGRSKVSGAGRGVFAVCPIARDELIERCPVILLPDRKDRSRLRQTGLVNYYFLWGEERDRAAICLGWGSIYNHSFAPNAKYEKDIKGDHMDFHALRDIAQGEEILVNYNGDPDDKTPLRIPGLPVEAGGAGPSPWPIDGLARRWRLAYRWLFGNRLALIPFTVASDSLIVFI